MAYYAHSKENEPKENWQLLKEHLYNTADVASKFAAVFQSSEFAWIAGMMHDIGKYSNEFQSKLHGKKLFVDHSTAGAQLALKNYGPALGALFSYCVAGHHAGIPDYGTVNKNSSLALRLKSVVKDYSKYSEEILLPQFKKMLPISATNKEYQYFTIAFYIRMLFSCLVDADFLDTERFMKNGDVNRDIGENIYVLYEKLMLHMETLKNKKDHINQERRKVFQRCVQMASYKKGFFSMTVPTGGGKTLSSMAFALGHAIKNNMNRIIYVIPYTSIIEQNAKVFSGILGEDNVLEHHSSYRIDDDFYEDTNLYERMRYAEENWDIPIVVTTNVQFYESLFSNKPSKCRKLHNITNSVIILDEAQMIPTQYLKPCLAALWELVFNYNCTVLFCTATQPALNEIYNDLQITEIIESPIHLFNEFKRVEVSNIGKIDDSELSDLLLESDQVLCIVNTRKHAKELYGKIQQYDGSYHLSTLMCAAHRREILSEIKKRLSGGEICRVVSTQLIEAGVDIDFPVVYRSSAGLDSIAQSAGRCNREWKAKKGNVFVFYSTEDYATALGWLSKTQSAGEMAMRQFTDPLSPDAIRYYFQQLYDYERDNRFDNRKIMECFEKSGAQLRFEFAEASSRFKLIDDNTYPVVIPYNHDAEKLIQEARFANGTKNSMRKLQQYTVSIYENEYNSLLGVGALEDVNGLFMLLKNKEQRYDAREGLIIPKGGEALFA
jgi:CRISPR-associated helicase Cas3/CRISPR-associated endonuclease Cas3-HD